MSTAPDLATRLRAWEDADEPRGFVVRLPLFSANERLIPVIRYTRHGKPYPVLVPSPEYTAWKKEAGQELMIQRPKPVRGRVAVSLVIVPRSGQQDADNCIKPALDLLVEHRLIDQDNVGVVPCGDWQTWLTKQEAIPKGHMQVRVRGLPEAAE